MVTVSTAGSYHRTTSASTSAWGKDAVASKVEIRWPSGIVQTLTDVKGDRIVQVDEPSQPAAAHK
jgi:hypothetical protein